VLDVLQYFHVAKEVRNGSDLLDPQEQEFSEEEKQLVGEELGLGLQLEPQAQQQQPLAHKELQIHNHVWHFHKHQFVHNHILCRNSWGKSYNSRKA